MVFEGVTEEVQIPNNAEVTIRDLKRVIRNAFPDEASFARQLPIVKKGGVYLNTIAPLPPSFHPVIFFDRSIQCYKITKQYEVVN